MRAGQLLQALIEQRAAAAVAFFLVDAVLTCIIVAKVPYTEIDWIAYMEEVEGVMGGVSFEQRRLAPCRTVGALRVLTPTTQLRQEYDYSKLRGQTGPLVYPGGFVWVYAGLRKLTNDGKDIATAQMLFVGIYLATQAVVLRIYVKAKLVPAWALGLLV